MDEACWGPTGWGLMNMGKSQGLFGACLGVGLLVLLIEFLDRKELNMVKDICGTVGPLWVIRNGLKLRQLQKATVGWEYHV